MQPAATAMIRSVMMSFLTGCRFLTEYLFDRICMIPPLLKKIISQDCCEIMNSR